MNCEGVLEVSVVMPCLNEHETVGVCVQKALDALAKSGLAGEVIVDDTAVLKAQSRPPHHSAPGSLILNTPDYCTFVARL